MNSDIEFMIQIYNTYDIDWMGDEIKSPSSLTRHHIIKRENEGEDDINNYALLTNDSHHLMHYMEDKNYKDYCELNNLFLELNRSMMPPTSEYFEKVRSIIKKVRKEIKYNKRRAR